jgi:hypothetical protein
LGTNLVKRSNLLITSFLVSQEVKERARPYSKSQMRYTNSTMNTDGFASNAAALQATRDLQQKSIDALHRIQSQAAETQAIGLETMQQLDEQDQRMDSAMESTKRLRDNLKKASKLQDRFGFLSLQMGNKKTAKKQLKAEETFRTGGSSNGTDTAPKFKRRGPRTKKEPLAVDASHISMDDVVAQTSKQSRELQQQVDRNELFADAKPKATETQTAKSRRAPSPSDDTPLTEQERRELREIEADDKAVDVGLDILGNQMEHLLGMAKDMGETVQQQNAKLGEIDKGLSKADDRSKQVNQRAKLFTMNRRQKRNEMNKFQTPMSMKASAAMAAMT